MTDDLGPTVQDGEEGPSEDRDDTSPVASTIPSQTSETTSIPGFGRSLPRVCCTTVLHTARSEPSNSTVNPERCGASDCCTNLLHKPSERTLSASRRRPQGSARNPPGLIVRGKVFHVRLRVPRTLAGPLGRTHVWRSLGT